MRPRSSSLASSSPDLSGGSFTSREGSGDFESVGSFAVSDGDGNSGMNSQSSVLFRQRFSLPISLVLQGLFAVCIVVVVSTVCAMFSAFIFQQHVDVAQRLMQQLSDCAIEALDENLSQLDVEFQTWMSLFGVASYGGIGSPGGGGNRSVVSFFDIAAVAMSMVASFVADGSEATTQLWNASVTKSGIQKFPKAIQCNITHSVSLYYSVNVSSLAMMTTTTVAGWSIVVVDRSNTGFAFVAIVPATSVLQGGWMAATRSSGISVSLDAAEFVSALPTEAGCLSAVGIMPMNIASPSVGASVVFRPLVQNPDVQVSSALLSDLQLQRLASGASSIPITLNASRDISILSRFALSRVLTQQGDARYLFSICSHPLPTINYTVSSNGQLLPGLFCSPGASAVAGTVQLIWNEHVDTGVLQPAVAATVLPFGTMQRMSKSVVAALAPATFATDFQSTSRSTLAPSVLAMAAVGQNVLDSGEVANGVRLMVLISVAIGIGIVSIGSFFIHSLTRSIVQLAEDFARVARFDVVEDVPVSTEAPPTAFSSPSARARIKASLSAAKSRLMHAIHHGLSSSDATKGPVSVATIRGSQFTEIDSVCKGLRMLVRHVLMLKRFVPSISHTAGTEESMKEMEDEEESRKSHTLHVRLQIRYESRSTTKEFGRSEFVFSFDPDEVADGSGQPLRSSRSAHGTSRQDPNRLDWNRRTLFTRLVAECLEHCGEDPFQRVTITYVSDNNEHVVLRNSLHVAEILSLRATEEAPQEPTSPATSSHGFHSNDDNDDVHTSSRSFLSRTAKISDDPFANHTVRILMQKSTTPKVVVQLTSIADVFNLLSTLVFVAQLFSESATSSNAGLIAFCCLYIFALSVNAGLCLILIRQTAAKDEAFLVWTRRRFKEICMCIFFSTLNLQNFELMWTGIRLECGKKTYLFFNAPPNDDCIFKSIQWSMFGFLFSDVIQLIFKVWRIVVSSSSSGGSSGGGGGVDTASLLTLITSGVSVLFNLAVKLHATFLWTRNIESTLLNEGGAASGEHDGVAGDLGDQPSALQLVQKDCSLVLVRAMPPKDVHQLSLLAVEWNQFYEATLRCATRCKAAVLYANSGTVLVALNTTRRALHDHETDAVHLALALQSSILQCSSAWRFSIHVSSGVFFTGILGSFHQKSTHVLVPLRSVSLVAAAGTLVAQSLGVIFVTRSVAINALGVDIQNMQECPPGVAVSSDVFIEGEALKLCRPSWIFASLRGGEAAAPGGVDLTVNDTTAVSPPPSSLLPSITWAECAFLFKANEPSPNIADMRTRFLSSSLGLSDLNNEELRITLSKIFERGWDRSVKMAQDRGAASTSVYTGILRKKQEDVSVETAQRTALIDEGGDMEDVLDPDDIAFGDDAATSPEIGKRSSSNRDHLSQRGVAASRGRGTNDYSSRGASPHIVVSPRKLFGL